jgi:hypothetical protein
MERMGRAWDITRASWWVLVSHPLLLVVAVVATVISALVAVGIAGIGYLLVRPEEPWYELPGGAMWPFYGLALVVSGWVSLVGKGAIVVGAAARMDGQEPDLGAVSAVVRERNRALWAWALLTGTVGMVLELLRERLAVVGSWLSFLGGLAFSVVSFLALPVIMFEGRGAVASLRRSTELLRRSWGENVTFNFAMGGLLLLVLFPVAVSGGLAASAGSIPFAVAFGGTMALFVVLFGLLEALTAVFQTALYRWTQDLPTGPAFSDQQMHAAFDLR